MLESFSDITDLAGLLNMSFSHTVQNKFDSTQRCVDKTKNLINNMNNCFVTVKVVSHINWSM